MLLPTRPVAKQVGRGALGNRTATAIDYRPTFKRDGKIGLADDDKQQLLARICDVLERHGEAALLGAPAETAAYRWLSHGFTDVEDIEDWLAARCFDPARAHHGRPRQLRRHHRLQDFPRRPLPRRGPPHHHQRLLELLTVNSER
jgi:hypothetical protein